MTLVFFEPPPDFQAQISVAGCYCEFGDKILLLKRTPHKHQGNTWGIPGGKLNEGETPQAATVREVFEEVGLSILEGNLEEIGKMYIRGPLNDYIFYRFRVPLLALPVLNVSLEEHVEARWVTIEEALKLPLIYGGREALLNYQKFISNL